VNNLIKTGMVIRYLLLVLMIHEPTGHGSGQSPETSQNRPPDSLPWITLSELTAREQLEPFSLRVIILTMNRPESLVRLLNSLSNTFFEEPTDTLHVEIHVDKAHGNFAMGKKNKMPRS
jgi:hypothetical protein